MGAKAISRIKPYENPEDWHIDDHYGDSQTFCIATPRGLPIKEWGSDPSSPSSPQKEWTGRNIVLPRLQIGNLEGDAADLTGKLESDRRGSTSGEVHSPELFSFGPASIENGEETPRSVDGLVQQLAGLVSQLETSDTDMAQRLVTVEVERNELHNFVYSLNEQIANMYSANSAQAFQSQQIIASLNEQIAAAHAAHMALASEHGAVSESLAELQKESREMQKENQQLRADQKDRVSSEEFEAAENRYALLEKEFESFKTSAQQRVDTLEMSLHTQEGDYKSRLSEDSQRAAALEKERKELSSTISSLQEQIAEMQATATSRALENAKVLEHLNKQDQNNQQLLQEKQQIMTRLAAQEALVKERFAPEDYQAMKTQYQAVQREFDAYKVNADGRISDLEASLKSKVEKHQIELSLEVERLASTEKQRNELSDTVSSLNEQILVLQASTASKAAESALALEKIERLEKSLEAQAGNFQVQLTSESQRLSTAEKARCELCNTVSMLNEQIATMQAATTSSAVESAKVMELLAKQEQDLRVMVQEKQQALTRLAEQEVLTLERVPLDDHQALKTRYQEMEKEFDAYKVSADRRTSLLETSLESQAADHQNLLRLESQRLASAEKEQSDLTDAVASLNEKLASAEKERSNLSDTVSSLNEQLIIMQAATALRGAESAKVVELLAKQEQANQQLLQERQQALARVAEQERLLQERILAGDYHALKREHHVVQQELEMLRATFSECESKLSYESERRAAVEKERTELSYTVGSLNDQITAMHAATASRVAESAKVMEILSKQEQDNQQLLQEKQAALSRLAAQESEAQESLVSREDYESMKNQFQATKTLYDAVQSELEAHKVSAERKIGLLEKSLETQAEDFQTQLQSEVQRLAAAKKERSDLFDMVTSLNEQLANIQTATVSKSEESGKVIELLTKKEQENEVILLEKHQALERLAEKEAMLQERVPVEDYQALKREHQVMQQNFESLRLKHESEVIELDAKLQTTTSEYESKLSLQNERGAAFEKERSELSDTIACLNEQITSMQTASASRAVESSKVLELLSKHEEEKQQLLQEKQQLWQEKQEIVVRLAEKEAMLQEHVPAEEHRKLKYEHEARQQEIESLKSRTDRKIRDLEATLQETAHEYESKVAMEGERRAAIEKERIELSNAVSSLNDQLTSMQAMLQERVPNEDFQALKHEHQAMQQEHELLKLKTAGKIKDLEASLEESSKEYESKLSLESERRATFEKERNELSDAVSSLNEQLASIQAATTARGSESAKIMELLAKQEQDSQQLLQDKLQALANLAEKETLLQERVPVDDFRALKREYETIQQELESLKLKTDRQIRNLEAIVQEKSQESEAKLKLESERQALVEMERIQLSKTISSMTDQLEFMQEAVASKGSESAKLMELLAKQEEGNQQLLQEKQEVLVRLSEKEAMLQCRVPIDDFQALQHEHHCIRQELESIKVKTSCKIKDLEASLQEGSKEYESKLSLEGERRAALERERNELSSTVSSLQEQLTSMQAAIASRESTKMVELLAKQDQDSQQMLQDKLEALARVAEQEVLLRERVPAKDFQSLQHDYYTIQEELELVKKKSDGKIRHLETALEEAFREHEAKVSLEGERRATIEKERVELANTVSSLNEQLASLQAATAVRASESAKVMELVAKQEQDSQQLLQDKLQALANIAEKETLLQERVPVDDFRALKREYETVKQELESLETKRDAEVRDFEQTLQERLQDLESKLRLEGERRVALENERSELSNAVSSLNEQLTSLQAAMASKVLESTKTMELFAKQEEGNQQLRQEKQDVLMRLAEKDAMLQERVPMEDFQTLKHAHQTIQQEHESLKLKTAGKIKDLEADLEESSKEYGSKLTLEIERRAAVEKERNELSSAVSCLSEQLASMQAAATARGSESAKIMELLAKQEQDNHQLLQDKLQAAANLAEKETLLRDRVPLEELQALRYEHQSVQQELASLKSKRDVKISDLEKALHEKTQECETKLNLEGERRAAIEKERIELAATVSALHEQLTSMQADALVRGLESAKIMELLAKQEQDSQQLLQDKLQALANLAEKETLLQERVPVEDFRDMKQQYQSVKQQLESLDLKNDVKIRKLEATLLEKSQDFESRLRSEGERRVALEKERSDLSNTVSSLNEQLTSMQAAMASKVLESTKTMELFAKQEEGNQQLRQEKQDVLMRLAEKDAMLQERVPMEDFQILKHGHQTIQQEHESLKLKSAAVEKEKNELANMISSLNEQIISMHASAAARDSTKMMELLAKQDQESQNMLQDKLQALARVAELETKLQERVPVEDYQGLKDEFSAMKIQHQSVKQERDSYKAAAQRADALEEERNHLSLKVTSLNEQITTIQASLQTAKRQVAAESERASELEQERIPRKEFLALKDNYDAKQQELDIAKAESDKKISDLEASLQTQASNYDSRLSAETLRLADVEKERNELFEKVSSLSEKVMSMQVSSTERVAENAHTLERLDKQCDDIFSLVREKQQTLACLAAQDTVSLEKHQALQQEFESYKFNQKQLNGSETSSLQLQLSEYQAQLRAESHRLAAVEKERDDLFSSVNSLNEKIASMEAASASRAIESANSIHRLDLQYQDILVMVQEKQRDLARFASIESVPFDIYQSAKKQFQNLHEELETYKIKAGEKLGAVEASLKAEVSKGQAQLNSERERLAAVESERSELYKTVNALNEQIANMRAASASQAVEAANTLGSLSKQYKDIFQVVQEKSQELASLKAADIKILQDDDTSGDAESVKQMYQALLHEFASYKTNADEKLRGVETALQSQVKGMMKQLDNVISQLESTDDAMARRLVAAEKERSELNSTVSSLTEQLATMQIGSASALDRTVVVSPQGKESGRFDDYEAIKTRYSDLQMEFEKYKMNANGKIAGLEASLQASLTDSKSMLTSENIKTLLERSVREIVHEFEEKAGSSPSRAGKCDSSEAVNVSAVTESNLTARAGFHSARASAARFDISSAASRRELSSAASTSSTASISSAASNPPKSAASIVQAARSSFGSSQSSFGTPSAPKPNVPPVARSFTGTVPSSTSRAVHRSPSAPASRKNTPRSFCSSDGSVTARSFTSADGSASPQSLSRTVLSRQGGSLQVPHMSRGLYRGSSLQAPIYTSGHI